MTNNYFEAIRLLNKYNQKHIIDHINKLDEKTKEKIVNQVLNIDFDEITELYKKTFDDIYIDLEELLPIRAVNPSKLDKEELNKYIKIGEDLIKNNKFAIATMAGGQGTRLRTL